MLELETNGHEESLFYSHENGVEDLKKVIEKFCREVCKKQAIPIKIDEFICEEIHARARETISFHRVKEYSIYKELAHIGYWTVRLKPLRIDSPMNVFRLWHSATRALDEWTLGKWTEAVNRAKDEEERLRNKLDFPINEHVVVAMIMDLIAASQKAHAENLGEIFKNDYLMAIADGNKRSPWLRDRLESSLRSHNHSARGFATLVESTFRTRCEA